MGSGDSKPAPTAEMNWIDRQSILLIPRINGNQKGPLTEMVLISSTIFNKVPSNGDEADKINSWKITLSNLLPYLVTRIKMYEQIKGPNGFIDKLVDFYITRQGKENDLENNIETQANTIEYYQNTKLVASPIDKKYLSLIGGLMKSVTYQFGEIDKRTGTISYGGGPNLNGSIRLYSIIYYFILNAIGKQFRNDKFIKILPQYMSANSSEYKFFLNMCVKVIEDKQLNLYGDGTEIPGIREDPYTDAELKQFGVFEDLESLKGCCRYLLFLIRKKNCTTYIMQNTKSVADENTYRICKISGAEPLIKPQSIIDEENSKKEGFTNSISGLENIGGLEGFEGLEGLPSLPSLPSVNSLPSSPLIEHMADVPIFTKIGDNLRLVLGWVLIVIIIGILFYISPAVFNSIYNILANFLVPLLLMILSFIGDTLMIMTKLISTSMEALFELLKNIFTVIFDFIIIFIRFGADGISGVVHYFIDQFSTIFKVTGDSIGVFFELLINLFSWIGDKIFNYMKKFYMTINNIQEE